MRSNTPHPRQSTLACLSRRKRERAKQPTRPSRVKTMTSKISRTAVCMKNPAWNPIWQDRPFNVNECETDSPRKWTNKNMCSGCPMNTAWPLPKAPRQRIPRVYLTMESRGFFLELLKWTANDPLFYRPSISAEPPACKGKALGECSFSVGA